MILRKTIISFVCVNNYILKFIWKGKGWAVARVEHLPQPVLGPWWSGKDVKILSRKGNKRGLNYR